jgi:hypothetical protein
MQIIQEVAAARHVLVICGSTEIDGYAFCLGLDTFMGLHKGPPALHGLIRSVTYLIRGAIFRPKYTTSGLGRFSLNICPLGELMDMYHTHEATKRHDKLYALLGMSSDDISKASLSPNYDVPWKDLLQRLVKFLLGEQVSVETWENKEIAVIRGRSRNIGRVSSVERNWNDRQNVHINLTNALRHPRSSEGQNASWNLQVSAKAIQNGDLVCLLQGASKPTIIRPCKDYFVVVMMVATPPEATGVNSKRFRPPELSQPITDFPHNFLLVWDWEGSQETHHNRQSYLNFLAAQGEVQEHLKAESEDHIGTAIGFWNTALILIDYENYEDAKERLRESIDGYESVLGKEHPQTLKAMEALASVYHKTKHWKEEEELLLQVIQTKQSIEGSNNGDPLNTMGTMGSLMSAYLDQGESGKAEIQKMKMELYRLQDYPIPEDVVLQAVKSRSVEVLALLLNQKANQIQITEEVVKVAAGNGRSGLEVMTLLLNQRGDEIQITEEVLKKAAGNSWRGPEVMTLLLNQRGDEIQITEEVVKVAAGNSLKVMTLLLEQRGDQIQITEEVVKAAAGNSLEVMTLLLEQRGDQIQITEEVVKAAAGNLWGGQEVMTLLLNQRGDEIQITEEVLKAAAGNKERRLEVMMLLLNQREDEIQITEEVLKKAAGHLWGGQEVMTLLLNQRGDEIQITEEVVKVAAGNSLEVMTLLLEQRRDQIQITEEVVKAAAGNLWGGQEVMTLLLNQRGDEIQITEEVLKAAAGNKERGLEVMMLLLNQRGNEIQITDEVLKAAAGNRRSGLEVMTLLLNQRGDEIQITEEVLKKAAGNRRSGLEVMTLLLEQRGDEIRITEEVVKAAAENRKRGLDVMTLLLNHREDQIQITKEVVKAAARNRNRKSGTKVLKLLLDQNWDKIQILEGAVVEIARWFDTDVMTLLLVDQRRDKIQITEEVVKAAAANENIGEEVLTLLFNRKGGNALVTEQVDSQL